jgi:alpha,alpha-trehalase
MTGWELIYRGFSPESEGVRETLCTLGNGYMATRGAAPNAVADGTHYPGTYLAGGYNRLKSEINGNEIESEDLVNIPNWLPLVFRFEDGGWLRPGEADILDYEQRLSTQKGVLYRDLRFRDREGRITRWQERRLVSMADAHLTALEVRLIPENWSGGITVRSGLDGSVTNAGVARYGSLNSRHLQTLEALQVAKDTIFLRSRLVQSRREIAMAARTRIAIADSAEPVRDLERLPDYVAQDIHVDAHEGQELLIEKIVAVYSSHDQAISEAGDAALSTLAKAGTFDGLLRQHCVAWSALWDECGVRIDTEAPSDARLHLRLHIFHMLQTYSGHSVDLDVGIPPRGWTGEAYRGHIMWDELFIFPFLNLRKPLLTRAALLYRYRRLDAARQSARETGLLGAMFPWQSGSSGREESQRIHLNPMSGRWIADTSNRQRHVSAAIAFNVWQYYEVTEDRLFLTQFGAELMAEIARFWASIATRDDETGNYSIDGVMGPDEFHTADAGCDPETKGGLRNNAYTNVLVSWLLTRTLDVINLVPEDRRGHLLEKLHLEEDELARWEDVSTNLVVPIDDNGIILQFEGYDELQELDWGAYQEKYGKIQRLDRILEQEGVDPNRYKIAKQADVLMLFYLFSTEELTEIFSNLGYVFTPDMIPRNIDYYAARTSHGSTLSWTTHAWVAARSDRRRSWRLFCQALEADVADLQGGTTHEGIHLGAMAGTIDLIQRCYTGIEPRANVLTFNPSLPEELSCLRTTVHYRGQTLDIMVNGEALDISSRILTAHPITIAYRGHVRTLSPGQTATFRLISPRDRPHVCAEKMRHPGPHPEEDVRVSHDRAQ